MSLKYFSLVLLANFCSIKSQFQSFPFNTNPYGFNFPDYSSNLNNRAPETQSQPNYNQNNGFYFPSNNFYNNQNQKPQDFFYFPQNQQASTKQPIQVHHQNHQQQTTNTFKTTTTTTLRPAQNAYNSNGRISEIKCRMYEEYSYDKSSAGGLSLLHASSSNQIKTPNCEDSVGLIVGGKKAGLRQFPHMAHIGFRNARRQIEYSCGGSLISEYFVLSAAHCKNEAQFVHLNASSPSSNLLEYQISSFMSHPSYDSNLKKNDIALAKLSRSVGFSKFIRPACLNTKSIANFDQAKASGWGKEDFFNSVGTSHLMYVTLDIVKDSNKCLQFVDDLKNLDKQFCATKIDASGNFAGGADTCQGDSGGPLQVAHHDNKCMNDIIGVTSFGGVCGYENSPGVYANVADYLDWIEPIVWN